MQKDSQNNVGKLFAGAGMIIVALTVLIFLGLHSLNFFTYTFKAENEIFAYLGFGLTGGAFIAYVAYMKWMADTRLKKFIAISMIAICLFGELATAGFGMQLEAFKNAGLTFTEGDIETMIWMVRLLGILHGIALVLHTVGDEIGQAFKEEPIPATNTVFQPIKKEITIPQPPAPLEGAGQHPFPNGD